MFGMPDDRLGEDVAAAIVLRAGGDAQTRRSSPSSSAERIAKFKIPSSVWFRDDALPRNANGKFVKRELRDELVR